MKVRIVFRDLGSVPIWSQEIINASILRTGMTSSEMQSSDTLMLLDSKSCNKPTEENKKIKGNYKH